MKNKFLIFLSLFFSQLVEALSLDEIKERGYLNVGVRDRWQGTGYKDEKGNYSGFEVELARQIAKEVLGDEKKIKFYPSHGNDRISSLKKEDLDLVISFFVVNRHRKKELNFSDPYRKYLLGAISHNGEKITKPEDLQDKKVLIINQDASFVYFVKNYPNLNYIQCETYRECWQKFPEADFFINDYIVLLAEAKLNNVPQDKVQNIDKIFDYHEMIAAAVAKDNKELHDLVNKEFKRIKEDGTLLKLYNQTLKDFLPANIKIEEILITE